MKKPSKKSRLAQEKKRATEYKLKMKKLVKFGIYSPTSNEITKYRKTKINRYWREYGKEIEKDNVILVPLPEYASKSTKKKILDQATSLEMRTTRKGILLERLGHRRGKIRYNKNRDEYQIELSGRVKYGERRGKKTTEYVPLTSIDVLAKEKERFKQEADELGPLKKNEILRFKVVENGVEGLSLSTFRTVDELIKYLDRYERSKASRIELYRHIVIEKSTITEYRSDDKNRRNDNMNKMYRRNMRNRKRK